MSASIGWLAARAAERWPSDTFAFLGDETLSFQQLADWVNTAAVHMVDAGVGPSDAVLVHLPNGFEVIVYQLAAWRIGAVAVPVVPIYRRRELTYIVGDVLPRLLITGGKSADGTNTEVFDAIVAGIDGLAAAAKWEVGGNTPGWVPAPSRSAAHSRSNLPDPAGPNECCLILFTSGTTSAPKGVRLSSTALTQATGAWIGMGIGQQDVGLAVAPLAHIAGLIPGALLPLSVGCATVIMPKWNARQAIQLIDQHKATISAGAATFLRDLVDAYRDNHADIHRLSHFVSGGAATSPNLVRAAETVGMRASRAFGMTETAGVIAIASQHAPLDRRANYDGCLVDSVQVRVVDDDGLPLPRGTDGSLLIRGPQLMMGYTDLQRTAEQIRDGWFDPGDVVRVTADGWLQVTGRTKDIINRGGEKFSARDIEEALLLHPDIHHAAVAAVPHPRFGEAVAAYLVLTPGTSWIGGERVSAFLMESGLAKPKIPVEWNVVDEIPVTATGKIQKHLLAQLHTIVKEPL